MSMYFFAIFSSIICLQLILTVSSEINADSQSSLIQIPTTLNIESNEEYDYVPRSTSFLRFGRRLPSSSSSFLRFGRQLPSSSSLLFLRFGRQNQQVPSNNYFRFGRKGEFLRFG